MLTWSHLDALSANSLRDLRITLPLLARHGALRMVTCSDGEKGIVAMPGYAEDPNSRSLMHR